MEAHEVLLKECLSGDGRGLTRMTRASKQWLSVAAAWPICYIVGAILVLTIVNPQKSLGPVPPDPLPLWFQAHIGLHAATILVGGAVELFCLVYLFRESSLQGRRRVLSALLLFFGALVSAPFL